MNRFDRVRFVVCFTLALGMPAIMFVESGTLEVMPVLLGLSFASLYWLNRNTLPF